MKEISSKDNKIFKEALKLLSKKYRDESGLYLIEGVNLIEDAIRCGIEIKQIFYRLDYENIFPNYEDRSFYLSYELFKKLSQTENSQGIIGVVKKKEYDLLNFKLPVDSNILFLDRVQDPGNMGTILRTADAAGYSLVLLMKESCDCYQPKVVRAAMGSLFRIPVIYVRTIDELIGFTKRNKKKLISTTLDSEKMYYDCDLSKNICLVIGNEGNGISDELINVSDEKIKIPMSGTIESLNCAIATGILLYERMRKCKKN